MLKPIAICGDRLEWTNSLSTPLCSGVLNRQGSIRRGKHDTDQADARPAEHGVDCDCDQVIQFEYTSIHSDDPDQTLEYIQKWLGGLIDQLRKWIGRVGSHQLEHEAGTDQTIEQADAQHDQPGNALRDLLAEMWGGPYPGVGL